MSAIEANRLLIIDDDDVIAVGLRDFLTLRGWNVDTARDYRVAKSLLLTRRYAVSMIDVMGTGVRPDAGVSFLTWLREISPETSIIVLTAYRTAWLEHFTRELRIRHFFDKPVHFGDVVGALSSLTATSYSRAT